MMNKVILIGRLTRDIELRATASGTQYAQFDIAVDNGKDQNGNKKDADFITCVVWDKKAENLSIYVKKGHRIAIEGKIKVDKYQNDRGENKYKTYVLVQNFEFLENKNKDNFVPSEQDYYTQQSYTAEEIDNISYENDQFEQQQIEVTYDDLPF